MKTDKAIIYELADGINQLAAENLRLREVLKAHHEHHSESLVVFFEQDGKPIEISTDLGEAYQDSELCERTLTALSPLKAEVDLMQRKAKELDWLWTNCKIIFYKGDKYPIEHNLYAHKDNRSLIEAEMNAEKKGAA